MELIDEGLLHTYDKAIESYVGAKEEIGPAKAAIIALLNSYSSKMSDINLLIKNNRYASANIIIRTAFENEIYIRYILGRKNRQELRGNAYFYSDFQKLSDYLTHMDSTESFNATELIDSMNNSNNSDILGHFRNVNDYLNRLRQQFRSCFRFNGNENTKGLRFRTFNDSEPFQQCKIDKWKWYNDDNKTSNFRLLVTRLHYTDEYMALYSPTSDDVHSDGLRRSIKPNKDNHRLIISESYNPSMLIFFRGSVIDNIKLMQQSTDDLHVCSNLKHFREQAKNIYVANYRYGRKR